ncbi:membrane protein [hydrothermal vent metagenome]|uniref:Membrane protein n=1 Tax=hydrothermal vent metagenome TaxID=652676 RepID=A0A1W1E703_9ZZZZ
MQIYTDIQIYSVAILLFFGLGLFWVFLRFILRSKTKRYLKRYRSLKRLKKLTWLEFEHLCLLLYKEQGWKVRGNEQKGADGGVDLWMKKRGTTAIVQCKKYEDSKVTIKVIREMYGLMYEYEVDKAIVITTSSFTKECEHFVQEKQMELIDGKALVDMIQKVVG